MLRTKNYRKAGVNQTVSGSQRQRLSQRPPAKMFQKEDLEI